MSYFSSLPSSIQHDDTKQIEQSKVTANTSLEMANEEASIAPAATKSMEVRRWRMPLENQVGQLSSMFSAAVTAVVAHKISV